MKKIVLTSILLLIALSIHAQGIPRGGQARSDLKSVSFTNVSKTITIHKKEIQKKEIKKYDARVGFQQFVEFAPDYSIDGPETNSFDNSAYWSKLVHKIGVID